VAHEDDPERAVRAGLAVRDAIQELNEETPALDLHVRIAVNTGEAVVALDARVSEGEGMVAGDVVNTAARLQTAAPVDGILVGETTYRATERAIEYVESEPVQAKGKSEPVRVWEAKNARARYGVDVQQRGGAPLVGRHAEVDLLTDALARAQTERTPQLLTLVGVPGIGKSRLVWELWQVVDNDPEYFVQWRQGRSLPYGEGVAFWALAEMVKAQASILETDSAEVAETKLREAVADVIPDATAAEWVEAQLRPLVGLAQEGEGSLDRRTEAFAAWRRFFEALAERHPLVLVFEDLHWADDNLLDFVDHLVDWATDTPLLVIATARPELLERRPDWGGGKSNASTVSISPLSEEDIARLLGSLLDQPLMPAELQAPLLARAGGNPLYAEEYARMVSERGLEAIEEVPLPENVQGIVAARLDGLSAEDKGLIQDAAVLGKVFWSGALAAMTGAQRWTVEEHLHGLERKEFVRRERLSSVATETEYAFRHVLVRDVAYGQVPRALRAEKHRRAAEWIESLSTDREDSAEMLAHHYLRALEFARAANQDVEPLASRARVALRDAGDRAYGLNALAAAAAFYKEALELSDEEDPEWGHTLVRYGRSLFLADWTSDPTEILDEGVERLLAAGQLEEVAAAEVVLGLIHWYRVEHERARQYFEHAAEVIEGLPPSRAKAETLAELSRFAMFRDEDVKACELGREALQMSQDLGLEDVRVRALNTLGTSRVKGGEIEGLADLERSLEISAAGSPERLRAYINLGSITNDIGDLVRSREFHEVGLREAERVGAPGQRRWLFGDRAWDYYLLGRWDEAFAHAEELLALGERHYIDAIAGAVRGLIRMARDDERGALADSELSYSLGRESGDPQVLWPTLATHANMLLRVERRNDATAFVDDLLAELAARDTLFASYWSMQLAVALTTLGRADEFQAVAAKAPMSTRWLESGRAYAGGHLQESAEILAAVGAIAEEAFVRLRGADLLVAAGRRAEADVLLRPALTFYRSVGATAYLREAEELFAASA
jgi:tetratricopeptide (TPR) repeat protein